MTRLMFKSVAQSRAFKMTLMVLTAMLALFSVSAFASTPVPSNFGQLTSNVSHLEYQILKIVQVVVTLAGILLVFRGVVHLKQNASGSPQEKHLSKGIANIIFAAILFIVVPLLHMFIGTLGASIGSANQWTATGADSAGDISAGSQ